MGKNSFVMYNDWHSLVMMLSEEQAGELLQAIYCYHAGEEVKPKDKTVLGVYEMMCKRFEADGEKYEKICERNRKNGLNGGRPKGSTNKPTGLSEEPKKTQKNPMGKSGLIWVSDNDNDNDNDNDKDIAKKKVAKAPRFTKPSVDEIREYCQQRGNQVDPQKFFDFYESKGWKVGNQGMKDWKACVRTWESRDKAVKKTENKFLNFEQRTYDMDSLERLLLDN